MLSAAQIADVHKYLQGKPCYPTTGYHRVKRENLQSTSFEDVKSWSHYACYSFPDLIGAPHLLELANSPDILRLAAEYLGCSPTIYTLRLWWSFPRDTPSKITQRFHRDPQDEGLVLYVYLTDVEERSGPHAFVEGSHDSEIFLRMLRACGVFDDDNARKFHTATHLGDGYALPLNDLLPRVVPEAIRTFTGPAGTSFIDDVHGLHTGRLPVDRPRLMFSARYSAGRTTAYDNNGWWPQRIDWAGRIPDTAEARAANELIIDFS